MRLLKYSNSIEKTLHINSDIYIDTFKKKIQEKLTIIDAKSEIQNDTIKFKRFMDSEMSKIEALKILREGLIRVEKIDSNRIRIFWEVQLDILLFLSILGGLSIALVAGFASSMIIISMIIGLLFSIIAYFIGCSLIKSKIDELVETSI